MHGLKELFLRITYKKCEAYNNEAEVLLRCCLFFGQIWACVAYKKMCTCNKISVYQYLILVIMLICYHKKVFSWTISTYIYTLSHYTLDRFPPEAAASKIVENCHKNRQKSSKIVENRRKSSKIVGRFLSLPLLGEERLGVGYSKSFLSKIITKIVKYRRK